MRVQPTVAVDVAMTYTPTRRTVQVSNNIVRTWRVQPTVAVDVAGYDLHTNKKNCTG